jgi:hypothetical protein
MRKAVRNRTVEGPLNQIGAFAGQEPERLQVAAGLAKRAR